MYTQLSAFLCETKFNYVRDLLIKRKRVLSDEKRQEKKCARTHTYTNSYGSKKKLKIKYFSSSENLHAKEFVSDPELDTYTINIERV